MVVAPSEENCAMVCSRTESGSATTNITTRYTVKNPAVIPADKS